MSIAPVTGNTALGPPRLTGDDANDIFALHRWFSQFYDQFAKAQNVLGTLADHERRITALENKEALEP